MVEAVDHLEGSPPVEGGEGQEKVVCPECGESFNQEGYKVIVQAFVAQKPAPANEEGKEVPAVDPNHEKEPEFDIIPNLELGEHEQMQSHYSGDTELFLDQYYSSRDIEFTQEKPQQSEGIRKQDVVT